MKELSGKVAVVTGAASGIGEALARRFAAEGMRVVLADVERDALARVARDLGPNALAVPTDVARLADVEALARATLDAFGAVHVVCNNAGVVAPGPCWEVSHADWEWIVGVNLWGVVHGVRVFVPLMLRQDAEGHIVNTASMAGLVSGPFHGTYNVTKYGVVALSETLHLDLALAGARVKVSVLCPGWVNTRIADADRNRPPSAPIRSWQPDDHAMEQVIRQLLASGLPPERVADLVVDAIRAERLYVLTHPEWKAMVRQRMDDIVAERNPTVATIG
jgi:NAD(P)-dependent dehydrogenase (short-subunit alcohol dehydrogenase family)